MNVRGLFAIVTVASGFFPLVMAPASRALPHESSQPSCRARSVEVQNVLDQLEGMGGKKILSGQHNYPTTRSVYSQEIYRKTKKHPALWGQDFSYGLGRLESIYDRAGMVQEAIVQFQQGAWVTLMWHAVSPLDEEPVVFQKGVLKKLSKETWQALLTPGTQVHSRWLRQVDTVAVYLKQLQQARVPVLWRPYHEMNGDWFWWGAHPFEFRQLWRMMYDRLTCFHGLDNLIWVWSVYAQQSDAEVYAPYYPGEGYVDVLGQDAYGGIFSKRDYQAMNLLAEGKPIAWTELDRLPSEDILAAQPRWVWWMTWADLIWKTNTVKTVRSAFTNPRVQNRPIPGSP